MRNVYAFFLLFISCPLPAQKFDSLALTPPKGWNSWATFGIKISEQLVMEIAYNIVSSGMKDAGYQYIVLDDGWMAKQRDRDGNLVPDPVKFPHGMKVLADYFHAKGLKFGLYNCAGTKTCGGYPGTRGYEYQDARYYASLDVDYLKLDFCNPEGISAKEAYKTMSMALCTARRPVVFGLCEWGVNRPWAWAAPIAQIWRTTFDLLPCFEGTRTYSWGTGNCVMKNVDEEDSLRKYAGPGHWNDPDMLVVGNGLTTSEDRAHFTMWCMLAAPLFASNDIRNMSAETRAIFTNKETIDVDQDVLGIQGFRYASKDSLETWLKLLRHGDWAACFINRSAHPQNIAMDWQKETVRDSLYGRPLNTVSINYKIRDLWLKKDVGTTANVLRTAVAPHDVLMLRLSK